MTWGGWRAAADRVGADARGNRVRRRAVCKDATGNIVITDADHPVLVVGVNGCVIVHGPGGTLVCDKRCADRIKPLVEKMAGGREEGG